MVLGQFSERLCKLAVVRLTIEGRVVLGQAKFERDAPNINGTVDEDGTFGGTIGFQPVRGQFTRDEFEGTFKSFDCEWKALLGGKALAIEDALDHQYGRFKDFWREWA